jgi:hypothetical protein
LANPLSASHRKIPLFLFMFQPSLLRFHALTSGANPISGERYPASGIAAFLPNQILAQVICDPSKVEIIIWNFIAPSTTIPVQ